MPLDGATAAAVGTGTALTATAHLQAGRQNCIGVRLVNKNGTTPAYIAFTRNTTGDVANSVCQQVLNSQPLTVYLRSTVTGVTTTPGTSGAMAIGSSRGIYEAAPPVTTTPATGVPGGGGVGG